MRLLLMLESCGGGVGRHVVDLATGVMNRGHDVTLIYSPVRAEETFLNALRYLPKMTKRELPIGRSVGPADIRAWRQLRRLLTEMGPFDIVHGHSSKAGALLRLAAHRGAAPRVYTPHAPITMDPELPKAARVFYGSAERLLARRCERIICVSDAEREHLASTGLPRGLIRVVRNGIARLPDFDRDATRSRLQLDENTVCFGFVGRLSHQKAVSRIISAFAMTLGKMGNVHLVIVGDGPQLAELKSLAYQFGIARKVTFTGQAQGTEFMAGFDVFVLSSRYEGLPYVLLEAAASALPIISTDVGGVRDVVYDGENGFVLPTPAIELLADRLVEIARRRDLRVSMAHRSAEIGAGFTADRMVDETIAVYEELIADSAAKN